MASTGAAESRARYELPDLDRLELALRRLLEQHERVRQRAERAEARIAELEQAVHGISSGQIDPLELRTRVDRLEKENTQLRNRLRAAHEVAQRIHARLQFLEEER